MKKIVTIVGARPQFVKAAVVSKEFIKSKEIAEVIIHTGQHFDANMSEIFFEEMGIPEPRYSLDINCLSHGAMTGRMMERIEEVLKIENPDYVLVYGDTNSTLAGALSAKKLNLNVIHIEAGLRSYNMAMPEEINRILTDRISDILFCPTELAVQNLKKEGFDNFPSKVVLCGDVMEDAAKYFAAIAEKKSSILEKLKLQKNEFVICTIHRAENTDNIERLKRIVLSLNEISKKHKVVIPLHPRTHKILQDNSINIKGIVMPPIGYLDMLTLLSTCNLVLTDSGGIQKEAYFFNKFCITLRDETEWRELVDYEYNYLVGSNVEAIIEAVETLYYKPFLKRHHFYGNGTAAQKIMQELVSS